MGGYAHVKMHECGKKILICTNLALHLLEIIILSFGIGPCLLDSISVHIGKLKYTLDVNDPKRSKLESKAVEGLGTI